MKKPEHVAEYNDIQNLLLSTLDAKAEVVGIKRIQNRDLYKRYYISKDSIQKKYKDVAEKVDQKFLTEKLCFHGTGQTDPSILYFSKEGIDRRFTQDDVLHGLGAYFAVNAWYSNHSRYCYSQGDVRTLLICRVFHGIFSTKECLIDDSKPGKNPNFPGKNFDSVTNDMNDNERWMYVVFNNEQSYPQWEISYTMIK